MKEPATLSQVDIYNLIPDDFTCPFEKYIYGAIYNLYANGAKNISVVDVDMYLSERPAIYKVFTENNGIEYLQDAAEIADITNFNYYYTKLKKYNALKDLKSIGIDTSSIYPEDDLFTGDKDKLIEKFEQLSVQDIFSLVKTKIAGKEVKYGCGQMEVEKANLNIHEFLREIKLSPEIGIPLQGDIYNTVSKGGLRGKYHLFSGGSGTGKTRRMVGDACHLAYPVRFNSQKGIWEKNGSCQKIMYIATEQTAREIKPMILAYLSDINEDVIKYSMYTKDEESRLEKAMVIMDHYEGNFTIGRLPEPNITQVKSLFRAYALKENIEYFFYDYIFTTPSLLNEFRDIQLRNDQVLRMLSTELKNLAEELNIFVMSATQITGDLKESKGIRNEMLLRDSKSIPDKCDTAAIVARVLPEELNLLSSYLAKSRFKPTQVMDVYKNRGGRFYDVRIWSYVDLGTLRKQDLFITDPYYNEVYGFQQMIFQFEESHENAQLIKNTINEISDELFNPNKKINEIKLELPAPEENWDLLI